jgi:hypothetical protein
MTTSDENTHGDGLLQIPLNAFNDLVALSLQEETAESALEKIVRVARQTIRGADEVSITVLQDNKPSTVAFTGQLAVDLDERQYERGHGPCLDAAVGAWTRLSAGASARSRTCGQRPAGPTTRRRPPVAAA